MSISGIFDLLTSQGDRGTKLSKHRTGRLTLGAIIGRDDSMELPMTQRGSKRAVTGIYAILY